MPTDPSRAGAGSPSAVVVELSPDATIPDCRTCGACCYGDEMWIHVMAVDDERLGEHRLRHLTVLTQHGRGYFARSMKMVGGRCTAFRDQLADGGGPGCSIYEARPDICRTFAAGSPDCHAARKRRGIEPA